MITKYNIFNDSAFAIENGVINDSIGTISYIIRNYKDIKLENLSKKDNNSLHSPKNDSLVNKKSITTGSINCFYAKFSERSVYKDINDKTTETITGVSSNVYKIKLENNTVFALEIRNNDPLYIIGLDTPTYYILQSIAISQSEVETIKNLISTNQFITSSPTHLFLNGTVATIEHTEERPYYKINLGISGSIASDTTGKPQAKQLDTGIVLYSFDKNNWISTAYATSAFDKINGFVWDNQIIPNPIGTNPFGNHWSNGSTGLKDRLKTIIAEADNLPIANDKKGFRLLNTPIRDYLYQGDIEKVTFEIAFRLPFFIEEIIATPYTQRKIGGVNRNNNPYYTKFDNWLGYANGLRGLFEKALLNETGKTTMDYGTDYHDYNSEFYNIMGLTQTSFQKNNNVPAYMARTFEYENTLSNFNNTGKFAHLPGPIQNNNIVKGEPRNLSHLVTANVITSQNKLELENGTRQYIPVNDGVYTINGTKQIINGGYLVKNTDNKYYIWTFIIKGASRDLSHLVTAGIITEQNKTDLEKGTISHVRVQDKVSVNDNLYIINEIGEVVNGGWVMKDPSSSDDNNFYLFKSAWNNTVFKRNDKWEINSNNSGLTFGFGYDIGAKDYYQFIWYTEYNNPKYNVGQSGLKYEILNLAIGKKRNDAMKIFYPFRDLVWNILPLEYEVTIKKTIILAKDGYLNKGGFLKTAINLMAKQNSFWNNNAKTNKLLLRIYQYNFGYFYNENASQYLNEIEKVLFLGIIWNKGINFANPNKEIVKRNIHAFNTHDYRYLKYAVSKSEIAHSAKMVSLLKSKEVYNYTKL